MGSDRVPQHSENDTHKYNYQNNYKIEHHAYNYAVEFKPFILSVITLSVI